MIASNFAILFTYSSFKGFWDLITYTILPKYTYAALAEAQLLARVGTEGSQTSPELYLWIQLWMISGAFLICFSLLLFWKEWAVQVFDTHLMVNICRWVLSSWVLCPCRICKPMLACFLRHTNFADRQFYTSATQNDRWVWRMDNTLRK